MQIAVIDAFVVPRESRAAFLETTRAIQDVLKTLPGFVEGFIYEKRDGDSPYNIVTMAIWKDQSSFDNAKRAVPAKLQTIGINPPEKMKALDVRLERAVYDRSPF